MNSCICGKQIGSSSRQCIDCYMDPKKAALKLLERVIALVESGPCKGDYRAAIHTVLEELK